MHCPNCGVENPDGARFCKSCGKPLPMAQQPGVTPPPPPAANIPQAQQGTAPPQGSEQKGEQWWQSLLFCLLISIFCCWPVGVILYWTNPVAPKKNKIILTSVFVGLTILIFLLWIILFVISAANR